MEEMNPTDAGVRDLTVARPDEGDGHNGDLHEHGRELSDEQVHNCCNAQREQAVAQNAD